MKPQARWLAYFATTAIVVRNYKRKSRERKRSRVPSQFKLERYSVLAMMTDAIFLDAEYRLQRREDHWSFSSLRTAQTIGIGRIP